MGIWRFGEESDLPFVCTEYLLPEQNERFKRTGERPEQPSKCLLCSRYVTTYLYRLARLDPTFKPSSNIQIQAFGNYVCDAKGEDAATHSSSVGQKDGYISSAMLFVDETWSETQSARSDSMSPLLWRPVVRFQASNYEFHKDTNGVPYIVQVGVSQYFRPPAV